MELMFHSEVTTAAVVVDPGAVDEEEGRRWIRCASKDEWVRITHTWYFYPKR